MFLNEQLRLGFLVSTKISVNQADRSFTGIETVSKIFMLLRQCL